MIGAFKKGEDGLRQDAIGFSITHLNPINPVPGVENLNSQILMVSSSNKAWIEVGYPTKGRIEMSATKNELGIAAFTGDKKLLSNSLVGMSILTNNRTNILLKDNKDSKYFGQRTNMVSLL